jgi:hypothetical protein
VQSTGYDLPYTVHNGILSFTLDVIDDQEIIVIE